MCESRYRDFFILFHCFFESVDRNFEETVFSFPTYHVGDFFYCFALLSQYFGLLPAAIIIADAGQRARGPYIEMSFRRENKCDRKFGAFILLVRRVFCISIHQQWRQWPSPPPLRLLPVLSAACKKNASAPRRSLVDVPSTRSCSLSAFSGEFAFFPRIAFRRGIRSKTKQKSQQSF